MAKCRKGCLLNSGPTGRSLLALLVSALACSAVAPRLSNILPPGGQRGTETQVIFSGQRLGDTKEVMVYREGLTVAKLFLIDLSNRGGSERIVAFIAVGALMLVVGYFAPIPPAAAAQPMRPVGESV